MHLMQRGQNRGVTGSDNLMEGQIEIHFIKPTMGSLNFNNRKSTLFENGGN